MLCKCIILIEKEKRPHLVFLGAASVMDCEGMGELRACRDYLACSQPEGFLDLFNFNFGFHCSALGSEGSFCSFPTHPCTPSLLSTCLGEELQLRNSLNCRSTKILFCWEGEGASLGRAGLGSSILPLQTISSSVIQYPA